MIWWKGIIRSTCDGVNLTNSCLNNVQLYMFPFLEAPKGVPDNIWKEMGNKRKYDLVNWLVVCVSKDRGDLGVLDLQVMNPSQDQCFLVVNA